MRSVFSVLLLPLLVGAAPGGGPRTYLVSIVDIPLSARGRLSSFTIDTWGVEVRAICHIPRGWRVQGGGNATPEGVIAGEGTHGATWLGREDAGELQGLALVRLSLPVQRRAKGPVPATFAGKAVIAEERQAQLDYRNVRLAPATRCPPPRG